MGYLSQGDKTNNIFQAYNTERNKLGILNSQLDSKISYNFED